VTVAVQTVVAFTSNVDGEHDTDVEVDRLVTVRVVPVVSEESEKIVVAVYAPVILWEPVPIAVGS